DDSHPQRPGPALGRPRGAPAGRPVRPRQRPLAGHPRHPRRPSAGRCLPGAARPGRGRRAHDRRGGRRADRRPVRLVHGRRADRGARCRAPDPAAGGDRGRARPRRTRRCARAPPAGGAGVAVRRVRRHRRQGLLPLPRAPQPVRARAARRVLLPRGRLRGDPHRVPGPPAPPGRARRPAGVARRRRRGAGDGPGRRVLGPRHQPRRREDLHPADRGRPARRGPRVRLGPVAGRAAGPGRRGRRARGAPARLRHRGGAAVDAASAGAVEGLARAARRRHLLGLPARRRGGRGLRVPRPHAVGHAGAAGALEARRRVRRGRRGRGRRPRLRGAALPARGEGADGRARREPRRGLPAQHLRARLDGSADAPAGAGEAGEVHAEDRLPGHLEGLLGSGGARRRPAGQRRARRRLAHRHAAREDREAGRPGRVADDAADRQRLLPPPDERDRVPGGDPAAAVLRPRGRRRRQLRRHRCGDRSRDRPRLRRPGPPLRRRRHHDRLVDPRGPRGVRPALDRARRAVRRAVPGRAARPPGQRRADGRREHRRPRRADDRAGGLPDRHRGDRAAGAGRLHRRPAGPGRVGPGVAGRHARGRGRPPAGDRPALPARPALQRRRHQSGRVPRGVRRAGRRPAVHRAGAARADLV
ncbi:MAG: Metallopeptidase, partial [uncultured Pseudonocardia sp.]